MTSSPSNIPVEGSSIAESSQDLQPVAGQAAVTGKEVVSEGEAKTTSSPSHDETGGTEDVSVTVTTDDEEKSSEGSVENLVGGSVSETSQEDNSRAVTEDGENEATLSTEASTTAPDDTSMAATVPVCTAAPASAPNSSAPTAAVTDVRLVPPSRPGSAIPPSVASSVGGSSAAGTPPTSHSPLPSSAPPKKFAAINVNKQFLEKVIAPTANSTTNVSKLPANSSLTATTPASSPTSRLLTTKLGTGPAPSSLTTNVPPSSIWARQSSGSASSSLNSSPQLRTMSPQGLGGVAASGGPTTGGSLKLNLGHGSSGGLNTSFASRPGGLQTLKKPSATPGVAWGGGMRNVSDRGNELKHDFPTAKEAAEGKIAQAMHVQAMQQAAAAHQQHLLQELDAFRGVHLNPNGTHWDDVDDENDDFLDEVVEFGDGTQYKIPDAPAELEEQPSVPVSQSERFASTDTFDRHWPSTSQHHDPSSRQPATSFHPSSHQLPSRPSADDHRVLFNAQLNRLEPARRGPPAPSLSGPNLLSKSKSSSATAVPSGRPGLDRPLPPHIADRSLPPHMSSSTVQEASVTAPPSAPRDVSTAPVRNAWLDRNPVLSKASSSAAPASSSLPHRPDLDHFPPPGTARAPLPPQQQLFASQSTRPLNIQPTHPSAPTPAAAAPNKSPVNRLVPLSSEQPNVEAVPAPPLAPVVVPLSADEQTELYQREMHSAAERAKKRREAEEAERAAGIERARLKAKELEERFALQAKQAEAALPPGPTPAQAPPALPVEERKTILQHPPAYRPPVLRQVSTSPTFSKSVPHILPRKPQFPVVNPSEHVAVDGPMKPAAPTKPAAAASVAFAPGDLSNDVRAEAEVEIVDFSNLGSLMEAPEITPAPAASVGVQPPSRFSRMRATDFYDEEKSPIVAMKEVVAENLPSAAAAAPSSPIVKKPASSGLGLSPGLSAHRTPEMSSLDDVMQRIKGAMSRSESLDEMAKSPVERKALLPQPHAIVAPMPAPATRLKVLVPSPQWFAASSQERPRSPPAPWATIKIRFPNSALFTKQPPFDADKLSYNAKITRVDPLSWKPILYKELNHHTLSRDQWLLSPIIPKKSYHYKSRPIPPVVKLPSKPEISIMSPSPSALPKVVLPSTTPSAITSPLLSSKALHSLAPAPPGAHVLRPISSPQRSRAMDEVSWRRKTSVALAPEKAVDNSVEPKRPAFVNAVLEEIGTTSSPLVHSPPTLPTVSLPQRQRASSFSKQTKLQPPMPSGAEVAFYRERTPSIGAGNEEQLKPLVRFMVTSEIDDFGLEELGPKSTDPGYQAIDDLPEFASIMRSPSSLGGEELNPDMSSTSASRGPSNSVGAVLTPPSSVISSTWGQVGGFSAPDSPSSSRLVSDRDQQHHLKNLWAQPDDGAPKDGSKGSNLFPSGLHLASELNGSQSFNAQARPGYPSPHRLSIGEIHQPGVNQSAGYMMPIRPLQPNQKQLGSPYNQQSMTPSFASGGYQHQQQQRNQSSQSPMLTNRNPYNPYTPMMPNAGQPGGNSSLLYTSNGQQPHSSFSASPQPFNSLPNGSGSFSPQTGSLVAIGAAPPVTPGGIWVPISQKSPFVPSNANSPVGGGGGFLSPAGLGGVPVSPSSPYTNVSNTIKPFPGSENMFSSPRGPMDSGISSGVNASGMRGSGMFNGAAAGGARPFSSDPQQQQQQKQNHHQFSSGHDGKTNAIGAAVAGGQYPQQHGRRKPGPW